MRRFMVHLVTEIDFVSGTDGTAQNYEQHVAEVVKEAVLVAAGEAAVDDAKPGCRRSRLRPLTIGSA